MIRLFLHPLNVVLGGALLVATVVGFVTVAAGTMLPVHWGFDLKPDTWQPREIALLIGPAIAASIGFLLALIRLYGSKGRTEGAEPVIRIVFSVILVIALGIEIAIVWSGLVLDGSPGP